MWLTKPIYESLPYYYIVSGLLALAAAMYVDYWYWPAILLTMGFGCLIAGTVVWLKRKDYRQSQAQYKTEGDGASNGDGVNQKS